VRRGRVVDTTAETVAGDALGDAVLISVLSRIEDTRERAVFFAHVALDLPVAAVARAFGLEISTVEAMVGSLHRQLRSDQALRAQLSDIRRAGRPEHFLILAQKLNLQDWLCARCGQFMVQPRVGRPRKTCSNSCRVALSLAGGEGWKDVKNGTAGTPKRPNRAASLDDEIRRRAAPVLTAQEAAVVRDLLRRIVDRRSRWWKTSRDYDARNKALLLFGFTCPVQLSAKDLAGLTVNDVRFNDKGLDIRLNWEKGKTRNRQYKTMLPDNDPDLCLVRAMQAWHSVLLRAGYRDGPLFPQMAHLDVLKIGLPSMEGRVMASEINNAIDEAYLTSRLLSQSTLLPTFLKDVAARTRK